MSQKKLKWRPSHHYPRRTRPHVRQGVPDKRRLCNDFPCGQCFWLVNLQFPQHFALKHSREKVSLHFLSLLFTNSPSSVSDNFLPNWRNHSNPDAKFQQESSQAANSYSTRCLAIHIQGVKKNRVCAASAPVKQLCLQKTTFPRFVTSICSGMSRYDKNRSTGPHKNPYIAGGTLSHEQKVFLQLLQTALGRILSPTNTKHWNHPRSSCQLRHKQKRTGWTLVFYSSTCQLIFWTESLRYRTGCSCRLGGIVHLTYFQSHACPVSWGPYPEWVWPAYNGTFPITYQSMNWTLCTYFEIASQKLDPSAHSLSLRNHKHSLLMVVWSLWTTAGLQTADRQQQWFYWRISAVSLSLLGHLNSKHWKYLEVQSWHFHKVRYWFHSELCTYVKYGSVIDFSAEKHKNVKTPASLFSIRVINMPKQRTLKKKLSVLFSFDTFRWSFIVIRAISNDEAQHFANVLPQKLLSTANSSCPVCKAG